MSIEVTVKMKNESKTMSKKTFLSKENVIADYTDTEIDKLLHDAKKEFEDTPTKTTVTIKIFQ